MVMATKKSVLKVRNFRETLARGSKGGPMSPLRLCAGPRWEICVSPEDVEVPPLYGIVWRWEELLGPNPAPRVVLMAATCLQRVLVLSPIFRPACKNSKARWIVGLVGSISLPCTSGKIYATWHRRCVSWSFVWKREGCSEPALKALIELELPVQPPCCS